VREEEERKGILTICNGNCEESKTDLMDFKYGKRDPVRIYGREEAGERGTRRDRKEELGGRERGEPRRGRT
jgi:hypothetical protein